MSSVCLISTCGTSVWVHRATGWQRGRNVVVIREVYPGARGVVVGCGRRATTAGGHGERLAGLCLWREREREGSGERGEGEEEGEGKMEGGEGRKGRERERERERVTCTFFPNFWELIWTCTNT